MALFLILISPFVNKQALGLEKEFSSGSTDILGSGDSQLSAQADAHVTGLEDTGAGSEDLNDGGDEGVDEDSSNDGVEDNGDSNQGDDEGGEESGSTESGFLETEEGLVFINEDGERHIGWLFLDDTYYFDEYGIAQNDWVMIEDNWYYFGLQDYRMIKGWLHLSSVSYYLDETDGVMQKGLREIEGKWYYFNPGGTMAKNWKKIDEKWYYFNSVDGTMIRGEWLKHGSKWYFLDKEGVMVEGWKTQGGKLYYLTPGSGVMYSARWLYKDKEWYYFNTSGSMAKGWKQVSGSWYYLNPETGRMHKSEFLKQNQRTYYLNSTGRMLEGWGKFNGKWYYFSPGSGRMAEGLIKDKGVYYFLNSRGELIWSVKNNHWYVENSSRNGSARSRIIIISESEQKLWVYDNGRVLFQTDVVTGNLRLGYPTHKGNFYVMTKERNIYLANCNRYGYCWNVPVSYWMQFNSLGMIEGIHDSSREVFGGDVYKTDGSYGCVNVPPAVMGQLFNLSRVGMGVYVY